MSSREYHQQYYNNNKDKIKSQITAYRKSHPEWAEAYRRQWYTKNRARILERDNEERDNIRQLIRKAKNVPCKDCGSCFPYFVMDFDHVKGKKLYNVASMTNKKSREVICEIKKCDVVCANCHRIRTHRRR